MSFKKKSPREIVEYCFGRAIEYHRQGLVDSAVSYLCDIVKLVCDVNVSKALLYNNCTNTQYICEDNDKYREIVVWNPLTRAKLIVSIERIEKDGKEVINVYVEYSDKVNSVVHRKYFE